MTVVNISTEYLSIMNLVLMKNLVAKLLIYVSQLCSAVERNTSSFFLFEVNLPNLKKKINKKTSGEEPTKQRSKYMVCPN